MNDDHAAKSALTLKQRKEKLIREGAGYRAAVRGSRDVISHNLHADVLARSAIAQVKSTVYATAGKLLRLKGANLQTLVPVVVSTASFLMKIRLSRPMLRTAAIAGTLATGAYFLYRKKPKVQRLRLPN